MTIYSLFNMVEREREAVQRLYTRPTVLQMFQHSLPDMYSLVKKHTITSEHEMWSSFPCTRVYSFQKFHNFLSNRVVMETADFPFMVPLSGMVCLWSTDILSNTFRHTTKNVSFRQRRIAVHLQLVWILAMSVQFSSFQ